MNAALQARADLESTPALRRQQIKQALSSIPQSAGGPALYVRALEVIVALTALTLTLPLQFALGLLIRRGTPGPALFHQNRIGRNGKLFRFVKFRTLYADAKQRWPQLYAYDYDLHELDELKYKHEADPRVTPQGRWMRFSSVDELPNFWNLLTGEVALVGPRPEILDMLPYYSRDELRKFSVRPGITGLAQISGRGRLRFKEVVAYDLDYVDRQSFRLDLKILLLTAYKIIIRDGAF
jgi:lipopolysaccharide/colanic/teichoic acid biosynthesis glycosyltransferase